LTRRTASCPNCGAEIVFRWSGAVQTTCPACRAILVRHDMDLEKVGVASDVPAAVSAIQLGTEGRFKAKAFTVVGRIIYKYELGHWNEWHIRFADETSGWLSDAQAEYAVTRVTRQEVPAGVMVGQDIVIQGTRYKAMSVTEAAYAGVEGELPFEYWDKETLRFVDLRGPGDSFATIDESEDPPLAFVGEFEDFSELRLKNLREDVDGAPAPKVRSLSCESCGAAIELRTGVAKTVACASCGAVMDARDDGLRVLLQHQSQIRLFKPLIPLGSVGKMKGKSWTVIGYQLRGITVEDLDYDWREYLLWNAEAGFRYLTEYEGHWNDVATVRGLPRERGGSHPVVEYLGTRFKHFQNAVATTRFVVGEFPWEVRVGDKVTSDDYVAPPMILSREATSDEITWSLGTYTSPAVIKEAFKLPSLPAPRGVFANQPNPTRVGGLGKMFGVFAAALLLLLIVRQVTARNEIAFGGGFRFDPRTGDTAAFVTKVFDVKGRASNVELRIDTDLDQDNAFFNVALLPESGGKGYEAGRDIGYYHGIDGGERWSEGSQSDRATLPGVAPGRYYLRIEPEHVGLKPVIYTVTLRRDVPRIWPFAVAFLVLGVPPLLVLLMRGSFETKRWAESDYAPEEE
jgi:predicted RNA-binding Zn-ribbon protein involved in translation (DUF1610 family)